jgi:hypothetical protein
MKYINFKLKDKDLKISLPDLENITSDEWFLSLQLKYLDLSDDNEEDINVEIDEDYDVFFDIINSFRFRNFMITNIDNINYYKYLGRKWCFPDWLQDEIEDKIKEINILNSLKKQFLELQECKNCNQVYNINENHKNACHYHSGHINVSRFTCCGFQPKDNNIGYCCNGYHMTDKLKLLEYIEKYRKLLKE